MPMDPMGFGFLYQDNTHKIRRKFLMTIVPVDNLCMPTGLVPENWEQVCVCVLQYKHKDMYYKHIYIYLVGGFNPFEKY